MFYDNLYTSEQPSDASVLMDRFFAQLNLLTIPPEHKLVPNSPISRQEVVNAIINLQNIKNPWPDGF